MIFNKKDKKIVITSMSEFFQTIFVLNGFLGLITENLTT